MAQRPNVIETGDALSQEEQLQTREEALDHCRSLKQRRFVEHYVGEAQGNAAEAARLAGYSDDSYAHQLIRKSHIKRAIRALVRAETLNRAQVRRELSQQATATVEDIGDLVEVPQHVAYQPGEEWKLVDALMQSAGGGDIERLSAEEAEDLKLLHRYVHDAGEDDEAAVTLEDVRAQTENGRMHFARVWVEVFVVNLEKARRRGALGAIKELSYDRNGRPSVKMYDAQSALKHLDKMYAMTDDVDADPQAAARSHLASATEKMGLNVNILNVQL